MYLIYLLLVGLGVACGRTEAEDPLKCPPGSRSDGRMCWACPRGYYQPLWVTQGTHCRPCYPGHYCSGEGLALPTGLTDAGFYCDSGCSVAAQKPCPPDHFCPKGTASPLPCPEGLIRRGYTAKSIDECVAPE